ncbi:Vacuolar protein sorting-associated protein 53 [Blastocladiella emersonii ATCC 22665]|nr:Vacuolar protein sorting-associated protein 53 [Blastocladiella emersonii ATCC 22665]
MPSAVHASGASPSPPASPVVAAPPPPPPPPAPPVAGDGAAYDVFTAPFNCSPLDDKTFDAVAYINQIFPSEQSLSSIDLVLAKLRRRVRTMDDRIQENLRQQTDRGKNNATQLESVTRAMQDLVGHIVSIKEKSKESERVVQDMTRDIKSLDYAKRNITHSMTVLKRLGMLTMAVNQLKEHAAKRQYRQIVPLLQAIRQLESHFRSFRNVPKVAALLNSLHFIQADLRKQIFELFDSAFTSQAQLQPAVDRPTLAEACLVLDGLEPSGRLQLQDWYSSLVLREYRSIFNGKDELTSLDNVPRRFAWLRRYLKSYDDEHSSVFPSAWRMDHELCMRFCTESKGGIAAAAAGVKDVKALLKAMKATVEFEGYLVQRWRGGDSSGAGGDAEEPTAYRSMSEALEPALGPYVESEDRRLADLVGRLAQAGLAVDEGNPSVLASATELFVTYKELLAQVAKLSHGKLLADVAGIMGKHLDRYADTLNGFVRDERRGTVPADGWRELATVLNTAQYCSVITGQLREKVLEKAAASHRGSIGLDRQVEAFKAASMGAVKCIVRSMVDGACEGAWANMSRIPWGSLQSAGDASPYVAMVTAVITGAVPVLAATISEAAMFRSLCDKLAEAYPTKVYQLLNRCKPINEAGAEQLLLDVHALKSVCSRIPVLGDPESQPTSIFTRVLNKGFGKLEVLLKVLLTPATPAEALVTTFMTVYPEKERTRVAFAQVVELKGLKRSDATACADLLAQRLASQVQQHAASADQTGAGAAATNATGALVAASAAAATAGAQALADAAAAAGTQFAVKKMFGKSSS